MIESWTFLFLTKSHFLYCTISEPLLWIVFFGQHKFKSILLSAIRLHFDFRVVFRGEYVLSDFGLYHMKRTQPEAKCVQVELVYRLLQSFAVIVDLITLSAFLNNGTFSYNLSFLNWKYYSFKLFCNYIVVKTFLTFIFKHSKYLFI